MALDEGLLRSKFGFNDPNVIRGILSDPNQTARYEREAGISSGGSNGGGGGDLVSNARQLLDFQREANQPAISSYQAQIPEISQQFSSQRDTLKGGIQPLKDRYNKILDEMKGRVSTDLSREYGRRGVPLSSGMYEQDLTSKINPMTRDINLQSEEGVRGIEGLIASLTGEETTAKRNILNAIAQLQSGESGSAVSGALSLMGQQQQASGAQKDRDFQNKVYSETTLPESQASIKNILSTISNRNASGVGGGGNPFLTTGIPGDQAKSTPAFIPWDQAKSTPPSPNFKPVSTNYKSNNRLNLA